GNSRTPWILRQGNYSQLPLTLVLAVPKTAPSCLSRCTSLDILLLPTPPVISRHGNRQIVLNRRMRPRVVFAWLVPPSLRQMAQTRRPAMGAPCNLQALLQGRVVRWRDRLKGAL